MNHIVAANTGFPEGEHLLQNNGFAGLLVIIMVLVVLTTLVAGPFLLRDFVRSRKAKSKEGKK